jgi:pyruvate formate lyase activating enzyme
MREALFYTKHENHTVRCVLCPWYCELQPGQTGVCKVRSNEMGQLTTHVFNRVAALGVDPIEKKPLYHFYPGKNIVSIGEVGCNLHCSFCQNHRISQCKARDFKGFKEITSTQIIDRAKKTPNNIGIAYTYNEPFTFYEFMFETAKQAHENGFKNAVVSNGYVNPGPLENILPFIDAFNIDLKAFTEGFYREQTKGKLGPVLETLQIIAQSPCHLEITNLVIPDLNDDAGEFEEMIKWIAKNLGNEIPLHLSRYFPQYKMDLPPTPAKSLETLYQQAKQHLKYVYLGNVDDEKHSSTYCTQCGNLLILRNRFKTTSAGLNHDKSCTTCGTQLKVVI